MRSASVWAAAAGNRRQRGVILPILAGGLLALLAVAALALDPSHAFLNKTRLQNSLDAGALAGAKVLETTKDEVNARAVAEQVFRRNAAEPGNEELAGALQGAGVAITVETSATLNPFVAGSGPAEYVRIRAQGLTLASWFAQVVGIADKNLGGSAVAGPAPVACPDNLVPMMICGDPSLPNYGYEPNSVTVLKTSAGGTGSEVGPGNFQLIRLDGGPGADAVRAGLAGNYEQTGCSVMASEGVIETEPGNTIGPVAQGLNTRFGIYQGPMSPADYPSDTVTTGANYDPNNPAGLLYQHADYVADQQAGNYDFPDGVAGRRELAVAIGDCSETTNGQGQVPLLSFGCFFLLDPASHQGNTAEIYGQFIETCSANGTPGVPPTSGLGVPRDIVLHKDPDSRDS